MVSQGEAWARRRLLMPSFARWSVAASREALYQRMQATAAAALETAAAALRPAMPARAEAEAAKVTAPVSGDGSAEQRLATLQQEFEEYKTRASEQHLEELAKVRSELAVLRQAKEHDSLRHEGLVVEGEAELKCRLEKCYAEHSKALTQARWSEAAELAATVQRLSAAMRDAAIRAAGSCPLGQGDAWGLDSGGAGSAIETAHKGKAKGKSKGNDHYSAYSAS